jgi:hypothetical protein
MCRRTNHARGIRMPAMTTPTGHKTNMAVARNGRAIVPEAQWPATVILAVASDGRAIVSKAQ